MEYNKQRRNEVQNARGKHRQEADIMQLVSIMGNQAVMQMCGDSDSDEDPAWEPESEDFDQEKRDIKEDRLVKEQYLDPAALRRSLGGAKGGEAHHIIPSCLAEANKYDADECNGAWNGILLPGSDTMHPINMPGAAETLPYHRHGKIRDHPSYTAKVKTALGTNNLNFAKTLARSFIAKIVALGGNKYIDDIS